MKGYAIVKWNGKIGYAINKDLGIKKKPYEGHYVYIRKDNGKTVDVNVITSLETSDRKIIPERIAKVRKGYLYPIPYYDANLPRWSAIMLNSNTNNIDKGKIKSLDSIKIKRRHKWFVGRFGK